VKHNSAIPDATFQRFDVTQIAHYALCRKIVDVGGAATRPHQQAQVRAPGQQLAGNVTAEKTRRTSYEAFH
jgi:hypothetical protein